MRTRSVVVLLVLAALAAAIPAAALGAVRFDREWRITGFGGGEASIATDRAGAVVYVADPFAGATGRVLVYDRDGARPRTFEKATAVDIERPAGLAVDSAGNLLVFEGDRNRIQVLTPGGAPIRTIQPTGAQAFDDQAQSIAVDAADDVYVADTRASRISVFGPTGTFLREIPLGGQFVTDVAVDAAGNVYALLIFGTAGCEAAVQVHDPSGAQIARWNVTAQPGFGCARLGLAIDPRTGEALVASQSGTLPGIRRYTRSGVPVGAPLTGAGSSADRLQAVGLAVAGDGTIFTRDSSAGRVLRFADLPPAPDLAAVIPNPRTIGVGPATAVVPGRISLGSLRRSKCVRTLVLTSKPARVTVRIFSGIRSIRLFGAKTVRFTAPGRQVVCIRVPFRARTFDARTRLRVSLAVALDAGASPRPRSRPIALTP
ncbi:MAG TPA: NHL repeat-containing protein [Miltoncostaeaceae bacterium]|nr:NHL repeat-containing protein [Miltoncostaeaceae bacterium]